MLPIDSGRLGVARDTRSGRGWRQERRQLVTFFVVLTLVQVLLSYALARVAARTGEARTVLSEEAVRTMRNTPSQAADVALALVVPCPHRADLSQLWWRSDASFTACHAGEGHIDLVLVSVEEEKEEENPGPVNGLVEVLGIRPCMRAVRWLVVQRPASSASPVRNLDLLHSLLVDPPMAFTATYDFFFWMDIDCTLPLRPFWVCSIFEELQWPHGWSIRTGLYRGSAYLPSLDAGHPVRPHGALVGIYRVGDERLAAAAAEALSYHHPHEHSAARALHTTLLAMPGCGACVGFTDKIFYTRDVTSSQEEELMSHDVRSSAPSISAGRLVRIRTLSPDDVPPQFLSIVVVVPRGHAALLTETLGSILNTYHGNVVVVTEASEAEEVHQVVRILNWVTVIPIDTKAADAEVQRNYHHMIADTFVPGRYIVHIEAGSVVTRQILPDCLFREGKPMAEYEAAVDAAESDVKWRDGIVSALGLRLSQMPLSFVSTTYGTISILPRNVYKNARDHIAKVHSVPFEEFIGTRRDSKADGENPSLYFHALGFLHAYAFLYARSALWWYRPTHMGLERPPVLRTCPQTLEAKECADWLAKTHAKGEWY